ncbi:MAG: hypothetical protein AABY15_03060 [Nanoarchaeota archaeon]
MEEKKVKIELNNYHHTCGDGCCDNYGTITTVNGVQLECHNEDAGNNSSRSFETSRL